MHFSWNCCLVDYLVDFSELSMLINSSLNILLDEVDYCDMDAQKKIIRNYNLYPYTLKTVMDDLSK